MRDEKTYSVTPVECDIAISIIFDMLAYNSNKNNINEEYDGGEEGGEHSKAKRQ